MVLNDNGVGRVYNLIMALKKRSNLSPDVAFGQVFGCDPSEVEIIHKHYISMYKTIKAEQERYRLMDIKNKEKYINILEVTLHGLAKIELNNKKGLQTFSQHFSDSVMLKLENCADIMSQVGKQEVIEKEKLDELRIDVDDLYNKVVDMNLDVDLKKMCLHNLENVRIAIVNYDKTGSASIIENAQLGAGAILFEYMGMADESDETKELLGEIANFFKKAYFAASFTVGTYELLGSATEMVKVLLS